MKKDKKIFLLNDGSEYSKLIINIMNDINYKYECLTSNLSEIETLDLKLIQGLDCFLLADNKYLNTIREFNFKNLSLKKINLINIIHPEALIEKSVKLGSNIFVSHGVRINSNSIISNNVYINHSTRINSNVTIKENVFLGSDCLINSDSFIGKNTILANGSKVMCSKIAESCYIEQENLSFYTNLDASTHYFNNIPSPIYYIKN
jgi:acetyltransferase-like isoleucine patch superfamily enzyme